MKYLGAEQVLFIHARIIDETGGAHGLRDIGLLKSAVGRPQATFDRRDLYPDVSSKAAVLMESLTNNHPFIDGNKRTSIAAASLFLLRNGFKVEAIQNELERFALDFALKKISLEEAVNWFERNSIKVEPSHEKSRTAR